MMKQISDRCIAASGNLFTPSRTTSASYTSTEVVLTSRLLLILNCSVPICNSHCMNMNLSMINSYIIAALHPTKTLGTPCDIYDSNHLSYMSMTICNMYAAMHCMKTRSIKV